MVLLLLLICCWAIKLMRPPYSPLSALSASHLPTYPNKPMSAGTWRTRSDALTRSVMESAAGAGAPTPAPYAPGRPRAIIHLDMVGGWVGRLSGGPWNTGAVGTECLTHSPFPAHLQQQDCFFAAVAEVAHPVFKGKPVVSAVLHCRHASCTAVILSVLLRGRGRMSCIQ